MTATYPFDTGYLPIASLVDFAAVMMALVVLAIGPGFIAIGTRKKGPERSLFSSILKWVGIVLTVLAVLFIVATFVALAVYS